MSDLIWSFDGALPLTQVLSSSLAQVKVTVLEELATISTKVSKTLLDLAISITPSLTLANEPETFQDHTLPLLIYTSVFTAHCASDSVVKEVFWRLNLQSPLTLTRPGKSFSLFKWGWTVIGTVTGGEVPLRCFLTSWPAWTRYI